MASWSTCKYDIFGLFNCEGPAVEYNFNVSEPIHMYDDENIQYVFFTGGFDSTFTLVYYLLHSRSYIQPIYIQGVADHGSSEGRKSVKQELEAMANIRRLIEHKFPQHARRLLPTLTITHLHYDPQITMQAQEYFRNGMHERVFHQYSAMAQICKNHNIHAAVSITNFSKWKELVEGKIVDLGSNRARVDMSQAKYFYSLLEPLRFPTLHLKKKDMLQIAKVKGFYEILQNTWSCWYPLPNGSPCGRCQMCLMRIL